jgi:ATP-dependent helicase/nuclease subunit B
MLHAFRQATENPSADYKALHDQLGPPKSIVPATAGEAPDVSRWWLHGAATAGESAKSAVLAHYPALASGDIARTARSTPNFTAYDGYVPDAGLVLDPCRDEAVVSPTQLEEAASCPFRYFLRRGLGVDAIETGDRDRDVWLDPLLRGTLLHDLYASLLRRCRADGRRADVRADAAWFDAQGRETLMALAVEMPPPSREVAQRETDLFMADLSLFLEAEAALDSACTPIGFEVGFGRGGRDGRGGVGVGEVAPDAPEAREPLERSEPVLIDLGGGLRLRVTGRIDRIDQIGPATFEIIDYKTGGYWPADWKGTFAGGTRLQHALYGLVATELLRRTVKQAAIAGAQYYFPSAKGQQERKRIPAPSIARVAEVLADLREVVARGLFVHAADESACRWCDYGRACGDEAAVRAAAKHGDARLSPLIRLTAHE